MRERDRRLYFEAGTQYYVAARFATLAQLIPICGNLFHHALEMYLKGFLSTKLSAKQVRCLRHDLPLIWDRFKSEMSDTALDQFDPIISKVHSFEEIRYPDKIAEEGMIASVGIKEGDSAGVDEQLPRPEPYYGFDIEPIDALARVIFEKSSVNPEFFTLSLNSDALTYLQRENAEATLWPEHKRVI